ncbi:MAG: M56 family metallopeptidase, partial [Amphiplicatus sp.]
MIGVDAPPALLCLLASLVWAPLVYRAASRLDRDGASPMSEIVWIGALALAALPTLIAPVFAAAGLSLRPAPAAPPALLPAEIATVASSPAPGPGLTAETLIGAAGLLYLYGALLAFGVFAVRALLFAGAMRRAAPLDNPALSTALDRWRRRLGVAAPLRVKVSPALASVCVYGLIRPVIVMPAQLVERADFDDLVMMGAHELAHIRRGDGRLFAAAAAAKILFWFNPFLRRIAARAELAAEQGADGLVLAFGADRRRYAACFVEGLRFAAERAAARVA